MRLTQEHSSFGTILTLSELRACLDIINVGPYAWSAHLRSKCVSGKRVRFADLHYTNPDPPGMPNELCFRFPLIDRVPWRLADPLVCLHPSLADARKHGLYFQGHELMSDALEDFGRFWEPLAAALEAY